MLLSITLMIMKKMIEVYDEYIQGRGYIAVESYVAKPEPLIFIYKQEKNDRTS